MTDRQGAPASFDALDQRVLGLERDVTVFGQKLDTLRSDFFSGLSAINQKLDAKSDNRWIWAPLSGLAMFILAVVGSLGTLSLSPVRDDVNRVQATTAMMQKTINDFMLLSAERFVKADTFEGFAGRTQNSVQSMRADVAGLHDRFVGMREHDRLLSEVRDAKMQLTSRDVFDTRGRDVDRRLDGYVRRLERVETEFFKPPKRD